MIPLVIIDDEESVGRMIARQMSTSSFQGQNYQAQYHRNTTEGYQALMRAIAENNYFAALLTDNDIESKDNGLNLIQRLKREEFRIPIMLMSAHNIKQKAIEAGADHFILKPIEDIAKSIEEWLNIYAMRNVVENLCWPIKGISPTQDRFDLMNYNIKKLREQGLIKEKQGKYYAATNFSQGIEITVRLTNGTTGMHGVLAEAAEPLPERKVTIACPPYGLATRIK